MPDKPPVERMIKRGGSSLPLVVFIFASCFFMTMITIAMILDKKQESDLAIACVKSGAEWKRTVWGHNFECVRETK